MNQIAKIMLDYDGYGCKKCCFSLGDSEPCDDKPCIVIEAITCIDVYFVTNPYYSEFVREQVKVRSRIAAHLTKEQIRNLDIDLPKSLNDAIQ